MKYENRPFENVEQMNETLIKNWNNKVHANDNVYVLGDFAFAKPERVNGILDKLNGKKYLIIGNHDHFLRSKKFDATKFQWIKDYATITDGAQRVALFHYPIAVWDRSHYGTIHLYGHVHSNGGNHHPLKFEIENAYNVGVDVWDFEPVTLKEILEKK